MDYSPLQTSHFYWITFIKNYLQVRSHSEKLGARALTYEFWRDRSQSWQEDYIWSGWKSSRSYLLLKKKYWNIGMKKFGECVQTG